MPAIPPELRLYDVDILPSGEVHAVGMTHDDGGVSLFAWIVSPGAPARRLPMPQEIGEEQPALVRGAPRWLAHAGGKGWWIGERDGRLVATANDAEITAAAATRDGTVWFADKLQGGAGRVWRATVDFARAKPIDATPVPLPSPGDLAAGGASACRDVDWVDGLVALAGGRVWLTAWCAGSVHVLLRTR